MYILKYFVIHSTAMVRSQDMQDRLKDLEEFLLSQYKENKEKKKRD